ncbi:hypothetical protein GBF38_004963 [Xyrichtys novacula]|uniref:G-protein coupled receptors family 1 profile domain-containing protein n=1 Tax=Xyrichtys novacula TaxID=13765 RepID=A0AAV1EHP6_XYRNO|nr:hypothetical protein GBF38_004963 [Xyrichtys novacula]
MSSGKPLLPYHPTIQEFLHLDPNQEGVHHQIQDMSANSSSAYNFSLGSDLSNCSSSTLFSKPLTISINIARAILILPLAVIILHLACQRWKKRGSLTDASNCDIFTYHLAVMELLGNDCTIDLAFQSYNEAFSLLKVALITPLTFIILYMAYQRWKQQGSWTAESHCDVFTYHLAVMELFTILGTAATLLGYFSRFKIMVLVGMNFDAVPYSGETLFHDLTCVERYLAVVHPLTYRGLKTARGVRIRNVMIGCVWLLSFGWMLVRSLRSDSLQAWG